MFNEHARHIFCFTDGRLLKLSSSLCMYNVNITAAHFVKYTPRCILSLPTIFMLHAMAIFFLVVWNREFEHVICVDTQFRNCV